MKKFSAKYSEKNVARDLIPKPDGTGLGYSPIMLPDDKHLIEDSARIHTSVFPVGAAWSSLVGVC